MIHRKDDYCLVDLTQGQKMVIDHEDLEFAESHTWHALSKGKSIVGKTRPFYACTWIKEGKGGKLHRCSFQNLLLDHDPRQTKNKVTVDHINRNTLDNRRSNLRLADKRTQVINRSRSSHNTSGVTGVSFNRGKKTWYAFWYENGRMKVKLFPISRYGGNLEAKEKAITYRRQMEREVEAYKNALCK